MEKTQKELLDALFSREQFTFAHLPSTFNRSGGVELALKNYILNRLKYETNYNLYIIDPEDETTWNRLEFIEPSFPQDSYERHNHTGQEILSNSVSYKFKATQNSISFGGIPDQITQRINSYTPSEIIFFNFQKWFTDEYLERYGKANFFEIINRCKSCVFGVTSFLSTKDKDKLAEIFCEFKAPISLGLISKIFGFDKFDPIIQNLQQKEVSRVVRERQAAIQTQAHIQRQQLEDQLYRSLAIDSSYLLQDTYTNKDSAAMSIKIFKERMKETLCQDVIKINKDNKFLWISND